MKARWFALMCECGNFMNTEFEGDTVVLHCHNHGCPHFDKRFRPPAVDLEEADERAGDH